MATDARAYYDVDTQGFDPTMEQTRAFNQATQRMSPAERQQLSDFFANQARKEQAKLPQNMRAPSAAPAPTGGGVQAQLDPGQKGETGRTGPEPSKVPMEQGEVAAVRNWLKTPEAQNFLGDAPQDNDPFMGENQRDQQMMQEQSQREALINYLMGMQQQNQYRPPMRRRPVMPSQMPYNPGWGVVGGSRVNPNPIGQQGPRQVPPSYGVNLQVPRNRFGPYGGY